MQSFKNVRSKLMNDFILHSFQSCRVKSHSWSGLITERYLADTFRVNMVWGLLSSVGFFVLLRYAFSVLYCERRLSECELLNKKRKFSSILTILEYWIVLVLCCSLSMHFAGEIYALLFFRIFFGKLNYYLETHDNL